MSDDKPPQSNLDIGARIVPTTCFVARQLARTWATLTGRWSVCPVRSPLCNRCRSILETV